MDVGITYYFISQTDNKTHKMKFHILQSEDKQWYCIIKARNGQVLFTSETYKRKSSIIKMLSNNFPQWNK